MLNVHCVQHWDLCIHITPTSVCAQQCPTHSNNWSHAIGYMYIAVFIDVTIQELITMSSQLAVFTLKLGVMQT